MCMGLKQAAVFRHVWSTPVQNIIGPVQTSPVGVVVLKDETTVVGFYMGKQSQEFVITFTWTLDHKADNSQIVDMCACGEKLILVDKGYIFILFF